jgi:hypothetical protein
MQNGLDYLASGLQHCTGNEPVILGVFVSGQAWKGSIGENEKSMKVYSALDLACLL